MYSIKHQATYSMISILHTFSAAEYSSLDLINVVTQWHPTECFPTRITVHLPGIQSRQLQPQIIFQHLKSAEDHILDFCSVCSLKLPTFSIEILTNLMV